MGKRRVRDCWTMLDPEEWGVSVDLIRSQRDYLPTGFSDTIADRVAPLEPQAGGSPVPDQRVTIGMERHEMRGHEKNWRLSGEATLPFLGAPLSLSVVFGGVFPEPTTAPPEIVAVEIPMFVTGTAGGGTRASVAEVVLPSISWDFQECVSERPPSNLVNLLHVSEITKYFGNVVERTHPPAPDLARLAVRDALDVRRWVLVDTEIGDCIGRMPPSRPMSFAAFLRSEGRALGLGEETAAVEFHFPPSWARPGEGRGNFFVGNPPMRPSTNALSAKLSASPECFSFVPEIPLVTTCGKNVLLVKQIASFQYTASGTGGVGECAKRLATRIDIIGSLSSQDFFRTVLPQTDYPAEFGSCATLVARVKCPDTVFNPVVWLDTPHERFRCLFRLCAKERELAPPDLAIAPPPAREWQGSAEQTVLDQRAAPPSRQKAESPCLDENDPTPPLLLASGLNYPQSVKDDLAEFVSLQTGKHVECLTGQSAEAFTMLHVPQHCMDTALSLANESAVVVMPITASRLLASACLVLNALKQRQDARGRGSYPLSCNPKV
mmetsp:Transcript_33636/g.94617  ORF Transcript_33636/g.94617 Transcript_33636/m.94617 type:complete len:550 (+) Transcript_33636:135-1784(+)